MKELEGTKTGYAPWHKAMLIACALIALIGTIGVIGGMVKMSGTVTEYGGTIGAPFIIAFVMVLLSVWLFAASGALLVYIAKTSRDIAAAVQTVTGAVKKD